MSIHVSVDLSGLNSILSGHSLRRARAVLAGQAMQDMDQFVPLKGGDLAGSAHQDGNGNIVYSTPYARAQFYGVIHGYPVKHYTQTEGRHPTKRWDLKAAKLYGDEWANKVKKSLLEGK